MLGYFEAADALCAAEAAREWGGKCGEGSGDPDVEKASWSARSEAEAESEGESEGEGDEEIDTSGSSDAAALDVTDAEAPEEPAPDEAVLLAEPRQNGAAALDDGLCACESVCAAPAPAPPTPTPATAPPRPRPWRRRPARPPPTWPRG